ncbi:MAG: ABC-F family ATP-binding cassette domain-containing protein [Phycisphaerales bacterium]|nr:ABC-F family ATP-binding cassette domain-containing protein [Phycisphaerales bacterium]
MLLTARDISKVLGLRTLFEGVSLTIDDGARLGLIGPNGAGKSTLLKILAGQLEPDAGSITAQKGMRAVYVPQQDRFEEGLTARGAVIASAFACMGEVGVTHDHHEAETLAEMILPRVGFEGALAETEAGALSGGWRKRLSIACALASAGGEPDLVLLDEPTNHLDLDGIAWLEEFVRRAPGMPASSAAVFVTHDRLFLERIATRVAELSPAYPQGILAVDGNYSEFLRRKEEFLAAQARAEQAMAGIVRQDLAWLGRGAQARRTKAKGRIEASYARMDELADLKNRNASATTTGARVDFDATGRRTRKLVVAKGIGKSYGGRSLFSGVDLTLGVGDCLGLLGSNGSGKTTLIRLLTGELEPDAGLVDFAEPKPGVAVFSQHREDFEPTTLLRDALCPVSDQVRFRGQAMHIVSWSRRFLFRDEQLEQPIKSLSGGELARIHIARLMLAPADVLVLDEPTNDLDIPTLETLEEALESFPGAIILVTHDRAMLDRLATSVLALDGLGGHALHASLEQAVAWRRRQEAAARPVPEAKAANAPTPETPAKARKKLSYNEQREYDTIEARIAEAEARVAAAEKKMGDPRVMSDHEAMARACEEVTQAHDAVAGLYARWEELERR